MSRRATIRAQRLIRKRKPKTWCRVYVLKDPRSGKIRYVGQTRMLLDERLRYHLKAPRKRIARGRQRLSPVELWIAELIGQDLSPQIAAIDHDGIWDISEAVWIDRISRDGGDLLNVMSRVA